MTDPTPTPDLDEATPADSENEKKKHTLPAHILGGMRTSTVGLIVAFVLILALYLYLRPDPTANENSPVYVPPETTTQVEPTQQYTPTRAPSTTQTTTPSTTTSPEVGSGGGGTDESGTTTTSTTTTPGFQLPTIPGLQLPNLAPTTTPAP